MIMNAGGPWNRRRMNLVAGRGVRYPKNITARYGQDLRLAAEKELAVATRDLLDAYRFGWSENELRDLADRIQAGTALLLERHALKAVPDWFGAVNEYAKGKFERSIKDAIGLDAISLLDGEVFGRLRNQAIGDSVELIKGLSKKHIFGTTDKNGKSMYDGVLDAVIADYRGTGFPDDSKSLAGRIQNIMGITKDRASFIARDQTAKLNGQMVQARQEDAGITHYIWRTAGDNRVVGAPGGMWPKASLLHGNHYERNGKVFEWAKPPIDGHPGEAIGCRCVASPAINPARIRAMVLAA